MNTSSKNNILLWVIIVLLILILSAMGTIMFHVHSNRMKHDQPREPQNEISQIKEKLNFTDEQTEKFKLIKEKHDEIVNPIKSQIDDERSKLNNEMSSDNTDTAKLNKILTNIAELRLKMAKEQINMFLEIKKICNPDQLAKFSSYTKDKIMRTDSRKTPKR